MLRPARALDVTKTSISFRSGNGSWRGRAMAVSDFGDEAALGGA
jgi:hypothetical protein